MLLSKTTIQYLLNFMHPGKLASALIEVQNITLYTSKAGKVGCQEPLVLLLGIKGIFYY